MDAATTGTGRSLPAQPDVDARVRAEQIRMVYLYSPTTTAASLMAGVFLVLVLRGAVSSSLLYAWAMVLLAHQIMRIFHYRRYRRANPDAAASRAWGRLYVVATTIAGFIWGSAGMLFFVPESLVHQVYLCLVLFGIASLTIPTLSIFSPAFYPMVVLVLTPYVVRALSAGEAHSIGLAVPPLIALTAAITFGRRINRLVDEAIRRRFENLHLIEVAERARADAEASNRAKSQFLATMSHELRTPLNAIIGYSELMTEHPARFGTSAAREPLGRILRAGRHLLNLINDLLDLARIEAGRTSLAYESVDLAALVADVTETTRAVAQANGNTLSVRCPPHLPPIHADRRRLTQVIYNLLSNACKFTSNGRVETSVTRYEQHGRAWIDIAVSDTGIGLTEEQIGRLFHEFAQGDDGTQRKFGGTGLGLVISRRLCQMMGGDLTVGSMYGLGSTFTAHLPAGPGPEAAAAAVDDAGAPALPRAVRTFLVVDADESAREVVRGYLLEQHARVVAARSGVEGIQWSLDLMPDAVIVDETLPDVSGWSVLAALRAEPRLARIPVIVVTASADLARGAARRATAIVTKPVDRNALARALATIDAPAGEESRPLARLKALRAGRSS